jgi:peptidoglycan/xylan/chitin deacetylase (PgdA/CDA1 family)
MEAGAPTAVTGASGRAQPAPSGDVALRLDDVGAASKRHEVYGVTRIRIGRLAVPFPGNLLFLKYLPPIKRWGPYPELSAAHWEAILGELATAGARLTVAVTAGWVERDGRIVPFPEKFPAQADALRRGVDRGLIEVANHGYTHCVVEDGLFRPRLFSGNRPFHREFYDWLPDEVHLEHLSRAQDILAGWLGAAPCTLVPPGNIFSAKTAAAAAKVGLRYISCLAAPAALAGDGITYVDDARVLAFHDRDIALRGPRHLAELLRSRPGARFVTVADLGRRQEAGDAP